MNKFLKDAILYEIYPTSFYDGNGDGVGDFVGITQKLDYIKSLGANLIWINPFYPSPFLDGGYDIIDFKGIDPRFGTMSDFEAFMKRCKELDIKVLIDMVLGHTSMECMWFKESSKSEKNQYSDYYIWAPSKSNPKMVMGMNQRDGGFYANYFASQPALNYGWSTKGEGEEEDFKMLYSDERLIPLRNEMINIMKFWLKKGVSGFRVDCASDLVKYDKFDFTFEDNKTIAGNKWIWEKLMGAVKEEYPDCIFLAEWVYPKTSVGKVGFDFDYLAHDCAEYSSLFKNEPHTNLSRSLEHGYNYFSKEGKGSCKLLVKYSKQILAAINQKGYFSIPTGCHDEIRMASGIKDNEVAKTFFAFILTFKNIPFIYYGDEIGIKHDYELRKDGGGIRTGARTPMQWDNSKNRGFSTNDVTYLPTNDDSGIDVQDQEKDEKSLLNCVKELIKIRKKYSFLNADADIEFIKTGYPLVYKRKDGSGSAIIMINPSDRTYIKKVRYKSIIASLNCEIEKNKIVLKGQSYIIIQE